MRLRLSTSRYSVGMWMLTSTQHALSTQFIRPCTYVYGIRMQTSVNGENTAHACAYCNKSGCTTLWTVFISMLCHREHLHTGRVSASWQSTSEILQKLFLKWYTCCDIRSYTVLECPKIPSRSFCVLLPKLEELNSWILRLGKAGLVVTKIGVRCLQTSLCEEQEPPSVVWFICPNIDFFGRCVFCATVRICSAYCSSFSGCKPVVEWAIFWCKNEDQSFFRLGGTSVRKLVRPDIDALLYID